MAQVVPGAEAWSAPGGDTGVLLLHGFPGSPASLRPLAERLARAGFAVELPRLPGHGTCRRDLRRTTWRDWRREARAADERLRARTWARVVLGLSMGGLLSLQLAQDPHRRLAGLVLVNPAIRVDHPLRWALPVARYLLPAYPGVRVNDIAKPGLDEKAYRLVPLPAAVSYFELQDRVRARLSAVSAPTLVLTSRQDHTVDPDNSREVLDGIASADKLQVWLERSYHVAPLDHDAPLLLAETIAFARRVAARPRR